MRCLLRSLAHFLIGLLILLLLNFKSSLYILDNSPLPDMSLANVFLPVCGLSFHSLDSIFQRAGIFNFNEVQLIIYFFHGWCFDIVPKTSSQILNLYLFNEWINNEWKIYQKYTNLFPHSSCLVTIIHSAQLLLKKVNKKQTNRKVITKPEVIYIFPWVIF